MSTRTLNLNDQLYQYLLDHSLRETETMRQLREITAQHEWSRMQISPEQGQFMALLVEIIGAQRIIEIGTYTGYSALCMAQALPEHGQLICCDMSKEWTDIGRPFWQQAGVEKRIQLRIAPALETLDQLLANNETEPFDLAFIDADKTNYLNYYERCLTLIRQGGLILFDNTLWSGHVADANKQDEDTVAIRALNETLHNDKHISMSLLPIGDGLTLVRKH